MRLKMTFGGTRVVFSPISPASKSTEAAYCHGANGKAPRFSCVLIAIYITKHSDFKAALSSLTYCQTMRTVVWDLSRRVLTSVTHQLKPRPNSHQPFLATELNRLKGLHYLSEYSVFMCLPLNDEFFISLYILYSARPKVNSRHFHDLPC